MPLAPLISQSRGLLMSRKWLSILMTRAELRTFSSSPIPNYCKNADDDKNKSATVNNQNSSTSSTSNKSPPDNNIIDPTNDNFFTQDTAFGSKENKGLGDPERPVFNPDEGSNSKPGATVAIAELEAPTTCCGTGCPNCVWIDYVEALSKTFTDPGMGREKILEELEKIDNENIKAFIMMELRVKKLI